MKRIKLHLWLFPLIIAMATACNSDGEYVQRGNTICHSYWTFSFGTMYDTLPEVDVATFKSLENWLGHDNRHAYFKAKLVPGVDVLTMKADKYPLFRDKNDYYYMSVPLHVTHVDAFVVLKRNEDDIWAMDNRYAYYDSLRIDSVDIKTFKVKTWNTAVDSKRVYRYGKVLPLADPETYVEDWKGMYSRDKAHIWYLGELLEDVDYETFTVDGNDAHDKNGHFYRGERVTEQQWKEIEAREKN
ncbi:MAG: DKNYY domain-containing protein [Muribaculaceae bacterium]|nr:DKNYY domain-containing protein [Muribaculaceae bacterium]